MITFMNRNRCSKAEYQPKRTYDVRITLNKSGSKCYVTRFGFINKGFEVLSKYEYITCSSPDADRIYFKESAENEGWKLRRTNETTSLYFTVSFGEKVFRTKWIGGTFKLKFDKNEGLYYIERGEEEND